MAAASSKYTATVSTDSVSKLIASLKADLRKDVRELELNTEAFSPGWVAMAESLARVAKVTDMERDLPKKGDATIWDGEEAGLRFVLEEGKLALIARCAVAHAVWMLSCMTGSATPPGHAASEEAVAGMAALEQGALGILANAWLHDEAIQTLEPAMVIELLTACFTAAAKTGEFLDATRTDSDSTAAVDTAADSSGDGGSGGSGGTPQASSSSASSSAESTASEWVAETLPRAALQASCRGDEGMGALSLRLLLRLGEKLERLVEGRVLAEALRFGLMRALLRHLTANSGPARDGSSEGCLPTSAVVDGLAGFALLLSGEEFGAAREELLADPDGRSMLLAAAETGGVIKAVSADSAVRRRVRPLLDLARTAKRRA